MLTLCIPIYKPKEDFFTVLEEILKLSGELVTDLIVYETKSDSSSYAELNSILNQFTNVSFQYLSINKEDFSHSGTRNQMAKTASTELIAFTTQDVAFPKKFWSHASKIIELMQIRNIDAVTVRHESSSYSMSDCFNDTTRSFDFEAYEDCNHVNINWWSNNFSFYKKKVIEVLPFPESVTWAEDLAWAKLAAISGFRLHVYTQTCIFHINKDNFLQAWKRGRDNAKGFVELTELFSLPLPKWTIWTDVLKPFVRQAITEVRSAKRDKRLLSSVPEMFHALSAWSLQALSRVLHLQLSGRRSRC